MTTTEMINKLAAEMGVSPADVRSLAQLTANGIKNDKVADMFNDGSEEFKTDLAMAYVQDGVRRFEKFQADLRTQPGLRDAFALQVLTTL